MKCPSEKLQNQCFYRILEMDEILSGFYSKQSKLIQKVFTSACPGMLFFLGTLESFHRLLLGTFLPI